MTKSTNIRMDVADMELAAKLAEKQGLRTQTYIKMLLHGSLQYAATRKD